MDNASLKDTVLKLKERIIKTEAGDTTLSETDTRQGLINPLFRALQWDFTDFDSIKSELRVPKFNEPVDYAFYSSKKTTDRPILLLEAKDSVATWATRTTSSSSPPTLRDPHELRMLGAPVDNVG